MADPVYSVELRAGPDAGFKKLQSARFRGGPLAACARTAGLLANGINGLCFGSGNVAVLGALRVTTVLVPLTVCARTAGLPACSGDCRMASCASSWRARLPHRASQSPARESPRRSFWLRQNEHSLMQARRPAVQRCTTLP